MGEEKKSKSKQFRIGQKTLDAIGVNPEHPKFRSIVEGMLIAFNDCKTMTKKILATEFSHQELETMYKASSEIAQYSKALNKKNLFLVALSEEEENLPLVRKFNENVNKTTAIFVNAIIAEAFRENKSQKEFAFELKQLMSF